jgi:transposase
MSAKQWVAHAGLDPRQVQSGTSIQRQTRISRRGNARLRAALYMPALTASRHDPAARSHHEALVAAGKTPIQANVAIMRKLLHGIHAIVHRRVAYDGARLFSRAAATPPPDSTQHATRAA